MSLILRYLITVNLPKDGVIETGTIRYTPKREYILLQADAPRLDWIYPLTKGA
jgi:hypothetical protein